MKLLAASFKSVSGPSMSPWRAPSPETHLPNSSATVKWGNKEKFARIKWSLEYEVVGQAFGEKKAMSMARLNCRRHFDGDLAHGYGPCQKLADGRSMHA